MISPIGDVPMQSTLMFPVDGKGPAAIGADPPALNLSRPASDDGVDDGYGRDDEKQSVLEETAWNETAGNGNRGGDNGQHGMQQMVGHQQERAVERETNQKEGCGAIIGFFADVEVCLCAPIDKIMGNSQYQQNSGDRQGDMYRDEPLYV